LHTENEYNLKKRNGMGFFSKSKEEKFKDNLVDFWNLLARLSFGEISWQTAGSKLLSIRDELFFIAQTFNDPFSAYFRRYTYNTGVFGEKTSIGEGIVIVILAFDYYKNGGRFTQNTDLMISNQAKELCSTESRRKEVREAIKEFKPR